MHLSQVSVEEAKNTVDLWYKERQEVLEWQKQRKYEAEKLGRVKTLLGRARRFPSFAHCTRAQKGHIGRAAINTPVQVFSSFSCTQVSLSLFLSVSLSSRWVLQGSAADVAMCAMLQISNNERLKELGWRLLLQVMPFIFSLYFKGLFHRSALPWFYTPSGLKTL